MFECRGGAFVNSGADSDRLDVMPGAGQLGAGIQSVAAIAPGSGHYQHVSRVGGIRQRLCQQRCGCLRDMAGGLLHEGVIGADQRRLSVPDGLHGIGIHDPRITVFTMPHVALTPRSFGALLAAGACGVRVPPPARLGAARRAYTG